jgi:hypothetical protein
MTQHETQFSTALHRSLIGSKIYFEKTNNAWRRGIPDFYYEAPGIIAWCEHKWIPKPWTGAVDSENICKTKSWPLQYRWLKRTYNNGQLALVMIGVGNNKQGYCLEFPFAFDPNTTPLLSISKLRTKLEGYLTHENAISTCGDR